MRRVMNRRFLFLLLNLTLFSMPLYCSAPFMGLSDAQEYATDHPEYVKPINDNWTHPDFREFHKQHLPSWFDRVLGWIGIAAHKRFDVGSFQVLLQQVAQKREQSAMGGFFSEQFKPLQNDHFLIWGDLFSAFHSLVRDLTYLQKEGVIDDSLKIIKPDYFFVFNGNVIDGSPYVLETLALVLQLMKMNPAQVFYTRGYHEMRERWHNFELLRELKIRGASYSSESVPFGSLLNRFFASLPIALYLTRERDATIDVVLVSNNEKAARQVKRNNLGHVLSQDKKRSFFTRDKNNLQSNKASDKVVKLRAYITSEDRSVEYRFTQGLSVVGSFEGATRWIVFSSPTERSQVLYKFFYDAFADLSVTDDLDSWKISLFNQKVPELDGFKEAAVYNLVTGREIFSKDARDKLVEVDFGATMDLSKGASPVGKKVKEGLELAFDRELATGSIAGTIPQITIVDDEYTPSKTRPAVQKLMKNNIDILIGSQGSASLESYLDLIKQGELLVLFPFTGSALFRKPDLKNLIHYRGSYVSEGEELIKYALKDLKSKKIAIFYQDDAFGRGALEGARRELKRQGITDFIEVPHERNVLDYKAQAKKIKNINPDTILFSTNTPAIRGLIRQLGVQYFAGKNLLGLSVSEDAFERFLNDKGLNFVLVRMVPDPKTSDLQIAKEYREWADKKNVSYDKVSFEQFINANILFHILRKIEGPVTKEKIISVAEQLKDEPFKGLVLSFNPQTRELSDTLWIDPGAGPWIERRVEKHADEVPVAPIAPRTTGDKGPLRYGSTIDLSKGAKLLGNAVKSGIELRLKQAREQGVESVPDIVVMDDAYTPSQTRKIVEKFIKEGIYTLVCPVGSATLKSYLDLVQDGQLTVLFPITGAPQFRKQSLANIVHLRVSYATEGEVLTQYALESLNAKKVALFYQNDAFGKSLLKSSKALLEKKNVKAVLEVPYDRNEVDFAAQASRLMQFDPDAILFFSTTIAAQKLMQKIGIEPLKKKHLLGNSDFGEMAFQSYAKENAIPFMSMNVVPNPATSQLQIVKEYRQAAQGQNITVGPFSLESYIGVDLLLHVLQTIEKPVSRHKIVEALAAMDGVNYKGLFLKFNPQTRTLLHSLWLNTGAPEWQHINLLTDSKTS